MRATGQWSTLVEGVRLGGLVKTEDGIQQSLGGWGLCSSLTGGTLTGAFEKNVHPLAAQWGKMTPSSGLSVRSNQEAETTAGLLIARVS